MNSRDHIVRDPHICGGVPVRKGTQVTLQTVLSSLAEGATIEAMLADSPGLTEGAVRAAITFAAAFAAEDLAIGAAPDTPFADPR